VNAPLTNVDNVIHGSGTISGPGTHPLTNRGTIRSDGLLQFGDLLDIVNSGRIEAVAGTRIVTSKRELIQNYENGVDGVIHAADGGVVQIGGYCCGGVDGGILSTEGSGIIQVLNDSILKDIHNIGNLQFGHILARGTFVNDGLIQGTMRVASPVFRIDGSGQWETTGSQLDAALFINGLGHTIAGSGGGALVSSAAVVVNEGTIRATDGTFNLSSAAITNSGLIHAPVGRTLGIDSQLGRIENTGNMLAEGTITIKASAGIYNFDEGQIDVRGQLTLQQTVLRNRPDGMIVGTGAIVGTIANGPLVVNEGVIEPGAGLATLQIGDDFQQLASGRLQMELSAGEDPASDVLAVNGLATLAGTLVATLVGEDSLSLHDSFTLLTASGGITGIFEKLELPTLADGLYWHMQYSTSEVRAFVDDVMPGDFNRDSNVDAADYVAWRKNSDSDVELSYFQTNFGHSAGSGAGLQSAVPEPASIWTLLTSVAIGVALKARRSMDARR
jgi:hypothetical protein